MSHLIPDLPRLPATKNDPVSIKIIPWKALDFFLRWEKKDWKPGCRNSGAA